MLIRKKIDASIKTARLLILIEKVINIQLVNPQ